MNHDLILYKLKNEFGVNGLLLQFLRDYLFSRKQHVVINGSVSGQIQVSSVYLKDLFLDLYFLFYSLMIYETRLVMALNLLYIADDTKIWRESLCDEDQVELQDDINKLFNWSVRNLMNFHPDK